MNWLIWDILKISGTKTCCKRRATAVPNSAATSTRIRIFWNRIFFLQESTFRVRETSEFAHRNRIRVDTASIDRLLRGKRLKPSRATAVYSMASFAELHRIIERFSYDLEKWFR